MNIVFKTLTSDNLFDFCSILDAIGVEQVIGLFDKKELEEISEKKDIEQIGITIAMKIVGILVKNMSSARIPIYTFLSGCVEWENGSAVTVEDLRKLKIRAFFALIKDFFKQDDLTDFFGEVAELVNSGQESSKNSATEDTVTLTAI